MAVLASSSSTVQLVWDAPGFTPNRYEWELTDHAGGDNLTDSSAAFAVDRDFDGLKSGTRYTIDLYACRDSACDKRSGPITIDVVTEAERWVKHEGAVIPDEPNARQPYAMVYGEEAGPELAGKLVLYYDPGPGSTWGSGLRTALSTGSVSRDASSVVGLVPVPDAGLLDPNTPADLFSEIGTVSAVPLAATSTVRLIADGGGPLFSMDSGDLLAGQDFHTGTRTVCDLPGHYEADGACPATPILQADGAHLHQGRVMWRQQSNWLWDQAAGTSMTFEVLCGGEQGTGIATYDGETWTAEGDAACPIHFPAMADPSPVHTGLANYKLYFREGDSLKVLYASGGRTGDVNTLDLGDWESMDQARDVTIDELPTDFSVLWPAADAELQVIYGDGADGLGMWVLENP